MIRDDVMDIVREFNPKIRPKNNWNDSKILKEDYPSVVEKINNKFGTNLKVLTSTNNTEGLIVYVMFAMTMKSM
jgi:hypothetical protein